MNAHKQTEELMPKVQARLQALPPEFTEDLKVPLRCAELMFRLQGGCPPIMQVWTTEDGERYVPVPDDVQSYSEIRAYMSSLLEAKPGATSVNFSFTSTPQGGGSGDGHSTLNCLFMTRHTLYEMCAEITGVRSLGDWTLEKIHLASGE